MDFLTIEYILKVCCAIAGVYMFVGTIGVYIAMNNEEERVGWRVFWCVLAGIVFVLTSWMTKGGWG